MKYRLKKWYPSLPNHLKDKEGKFKVEPHFAGGADYIAAEKIPGGLSLPAEEVENNPEYWDKVCDNCGKPIKEGEDIKWEHDCHCKEKDYRILTLEKRSTGKLYCFSDVCNFYDPSIENFYNIYSVERLSDGEIFTVGDKIIDTVQNGTKFNTEITSFWILDCGVIRVGDKKGSTSLDNIQHKKEPLFTTDDGVDIYLEDWFVIVNEKSFNIAKLQALEADKDNGFEGYMVFSEIEKAKEYIPCYSKKDIEQALLETDEVFTHEGYAMLTYQFEDNLGL